MFYHSRLCLVALSQSAHFIHIIVLSKCNRSCFELLRLTSTILCNCVLYHCFLQLNVHRNSNNYCSNSPDHSWSKISYSYFIMYCYIKQILPDYAYLIFRLHSVQQTEVETFLHSYVAYNNYMSYSIICYCTKIVIIFQIISNIGSHRYTLVRLLLVSAENGIVEHSNSCNSLLTALFKC